jgi:large subunit ribosomal protein L13
MSKTYSQKASEVNHQWVIVDASKAPLGRIATVIATRLTGKYKPTFTPHIDDGDYVVVINAGKIIVTGGKETKKTYYRHSGFPGGITAETLREKQAKDPAKVIEAAVRGMIPKNKLAAERIQRLKIYAGDNHPHNPQKPVTLEIQSASKGVK